MGLSHSPSIVTDGLVLCLDAANPRSYPGAGDTWYDISGNTGNGILNGTINNYATYSSNNAGILTFDGTDDFVVCDHPTGSSDGVTYEILFKIHTLAQKGIFTFNNATAYSGLSILSIGSGRYRFIVYLSGSNYVYLSALGDAIADKWYHIIFYIGSGNASDVVAYANGYLTTPSNSTVHNGTAYSPNKLYIGVGTTYSSLCLNADIPFVRCYSRALSASEVLQNYLATKSRFGL